MRLTGHSRFVSLCLLLLPVATVFGCGGGGGGSPSTGRAQITISWPSRGRLIPVASNSIGFLLKQGTQEIGTQLAARPAAGGTSTITFDSVPAGNVTLVATAYPNADGTGVAQATGTTNVFINGGQTAPILVSLNSTITSVAVAPAGPLSVAVGQTLPLSITAKDSSGAVVLTSPKTLQWATANGALASVNSSGVVTGVAPTGSTPGPVTISVTEAESGKVALAQVAVTSNAVVSINPPSPTISVGDSQLFTATVTNAPNNNVTWSVQEGAAGGSITTGGTYTAPATAGTYHVVATSQYDGSKSASVPVTVQSGGANVIIK